MCAELLIELGSGSEGGGGVMSAPASVATFERKGKAITLAGDEPKHSTTPPQSATHNEGETQVQSQSSLALLFREMLNNSIAASDDDRGLRPSLPHLCCGRS